MNEQVANGRIETSQSRHRATERKEKAVRHLNNKETTSQQINELY
jgi:hypothetical protein